jgi:RNA polymerase sigma-70 factor (TIGR02960 family)
VNSVGVDLIGRARAGDSEAFRALTEPYRRELHVHCYRMLGSIEDAEDALQDTLMAAWRGLEGFDRRAAIRTWLYRIATNQCINAARLTRRRPAKAWDVPGVVPPNPTRYSEIAWLEPYPDVLLQAAITTPLGPEAVYEQAESISLAFVAALQVLPPRQLAVLILRDVLGFRAQEVADMLDTTLDSVKSSLKRARTSLNRQRGTFGDRRPALPAGSPAEEAVVARFVSAYESADIDALVTLFTDDIFMSMPPLSYEYEGRDIVARFFSSMFNSGRRRFKLVRTRANAQPAFGAYLRHPTGSHEGTGLVVITLAPDGISAITRFESSLLRRCGLPAALPANG